VGIIAVIHDGKNKGDTTWWRESRVALLPKYHSLSMGTKISDAVVEVCTVAR
jgi:hypothetical protein